MESLNNQLFSGFKLRTSGMYIKCDKGLSDGKP